MAETIIIAGALAQQPRQAGFAWVVLHYLLGFRRLGWDVLFLDRLEPEMCVDAIGHPCAFDQSVNRHFFLNIMRCFGLDEKYALIYNRGEHCVGLSCQQVLERTKNAAFFLNIMGFFKDEEILEQAPKRVFLDIDPGFGQMWHELGLANLICGHDAYVTIGENIGQPDCTIPTCGVTWITTPQPIVLECWRVQNAPNWKGLTSIASWRGAYGPVEYSGKTYGLRVHEFRKFVRLPQLTRKAFELALDIQPADVKDIELLIGNGWSLTDPKAIAADPCSYQRYIQNSTAEFMVAKNMYVQSRSGWFSDRSICYLASGKPVLAQDTGLKNLYPTGEGLLVFTSLEEACDGVETLYAEYPRHAQAARAIAEDYFNSDKVLRNLLDKLNAI